MKIILFVGKNKPDSSLYFVAKSIQKYLPEAEIVDSTSDPRLRHANLVINIDWEQTLKLEKLRRFLHFEAMITVLAGDFDEARVSEQMLICGDAFNWPLVVHSEHSLQRIRKFAATWLAPAKARELMNICVHKIEYGIEPEFQLTGLNDRNKWIVPYNRIDRTGKNLQVHADLTQLVTRAIKLKHGVDLDHMFITGDLWVKNGGVWKGVKPQDWPMYRFVQQPAERDDYRSLASDRGMFLCTSLVESFGIYYLELICMGAVGIFLDRPWVRLLLEDYKFIVPQNQMAAAALEVYENYEKYQKWSQEVIVPYIKKRYNLERFVTGLTKFAKESTYGRDTGGHQEDRPVHD